MVILIDPPIWPAHGTTFAHLVSDESLAELHAFAAAAGISERAFDIDHYDVPAHRYDDLITQGAVPVTGRELISRLRRSGLRVPGRDRPEALRAWLTDSWAQLASRLAGPGLLPIGADLIDRWAEPHRRYHDLRHLRDVLLRIDLLTRPEPASPQVLLAAWFHDAVYAGKAGTDERASAALAGDSLGEALPSGTIAEVVRLVLLTQTHDPGPDDDAGALVSDADLGVLGGSEPDYRRYLADVRAEYAHISDPDFHAGRRAVVERLLALQPLFRTSRGRELWEARARTNLTRELAATD